MDTVRYKDKSISLSKDGWNILVQQRADTTGVMYEKYDNNRLEHYFVLDSSIIVNLIKDGLPVVTNQIVNKDTLWEMFKYEHPILKNLQICYVDVLEVTEESVTIMVNCVNSHGELICRLPVSFPLSSI